MSKKRSRSRSPKKEASRSRSRSPKAKTWPTECSWPNCASVGGSFTNIGGVWYCYKCASTQPVATCQTCSKQGPAHRIGSSGGFFRADLCAECATEVERKKDTEYEWCKAHVNELLAEFKQLRRRFSHATTVDNEKIFESLLGHLKKILTVEDQKKQAEQKAWWRGPPGWAVTFAGLHPDMPETLKSKHLMFTPKQIAEIWSLVPPEYGSHRFLHALAPHALLVSETQELSGCWFYYHGKRTKQEIMDGWVDTEFRWNIGAFPVATCPICIAEVFTTQQISECGTCHGLSHSYCKLASVRVKAQCELCRAPYSLPSDVIIHEPRMYFQNKQSLCLTAATWMDWSSDRLFSDVKPPVPPAHF